jgi:predicted nucleic acid-binding protein
MRSVDTSVLVRLLTRDDPEQTARAEAFVAPGAWVSHLVLAEATWVLTSVYDRSPSQLVAALERLIDHQQLVLQDPEVVHAALETFQKRPSLGWSDCLILEIARKAGHVPLGTLDRGLSKLDGADAV